MKTTEIIDVLNHINEHYGAKAQNTHLFMDAIDDVSTNYIVCEVWKDGKIDIYVTDDDEKFITNHCFDDDDEYFFGLESITVWHTIKGVVHMSKVF